MDEDVNIGMLDMYSTQELLDELEAREGVEVKIAKPYHGCNIGPCGNYMKILILRGREYEPAKRNR